MNRDLRLFLTIIALGIGAMMMVQLLIILFK